MKRKLETFANYYIMFCIYALIGWLYEVLWMKFVVSPYQWINRGVLIGPFLPIYGFGMLLLYVLLKKTIQKKHPIINHISGTIAIITVVTFIYTTIIEYTTPKIYSVIEYINNYGLYLVIINIIAIITINLIIKNNKKFQNIDITIIIVFLSIWIIASTVEYISHLIMDKYFNVILWDYTKDFLNVNKRINWDASRNFAIGGTFLLYTVQPLINKYLSKAQQQKLIISVIIGIPMLLDFIFHVVLKII